MKRKFNKHQLDQLESVLSDRKMLPCDGVHVYQQMADDQLPVIMLTKVNFIKGSRTQTIALAYGKVDMDSIQKQLWNRFGREDAK